MISFSVVKETHGWAVRMGDRMTTPFWSKDRAVWEANRLADAISRHGARTEVIVEALPPMGSRMVEPGLGVEAVGLEGLQLGAVMGVTATYAAHEGA